ncbi:MAG: hypothetical protein JRH19_28520 [Deltaproteobacteria bacterium]|nr:hypothetical protein [Deltaproteobacteria bacterium]
MGVASAFAAGSSFGAVLDLWIHPREEVYDPALHYVDPEGELYYHAENDIGQGIGKIAVLGGSDASVSVDLGPDLWEFVSTHSGSLRALIHYDSDGDGSVDKTLRGEIVEQQARFTGDAISKVDWRNGYWQFGVVYRAGDQGEAAYDGRYLSSVDSKQARVTFPLVDGLPGVSAELSAGLVIFRHRSEAPLDLAALARDPESHVDSFRELTPVKDDDDWTVDDEGDGKLRTHFESDDVILVRTSGGAALDVEWGDVPLQDYLVEHLQVERGADGCYSTLDARIAGDDGEQASLPHRILYCPDASLALFDAPDGYQIGLTALVAGEAVAETEASTSIMDNIRLYAAEVDERGPRQRSTGGVGGNIRAGFADAGQNVLDIGRHLATGTVRDNVHTGQKERRTSLLAAVPMFLVGLVKLDPVGGTRDLFEGIGSGVQIAADSVSAVNNAVLNPLIQGTVGTLGSPAAADTTGHWWGALSLAYIKNLPGSERSLDAVSPIALWHHNRAFATVNYTRTDTQLNIDRIMTAANIGTIYAIAAGAGPGQASSNPSATPTATSTPTPAAAPPPPPPVAAPPSPPPIAYPRC